MRRRLTRRRVVDAVNARTTHAFETLYVTTFNELLDKCQAGVDRLASRIVRWSRIQFLSLDGRVHQIA